MLIIGLNTLGGTGVSDTNDKASILRIRIIGRVQGVGYRAWFCACGNRLGLAGWVRNRRDGSVEALVKGGPGALQQLVLDCHKGPALARVSQVVTEAATESVDGTEVEQATTV